MLNALSSAYASRQPCSMQSQAFSQRVSQQAHLEEEIPHVVHVLLHVSWRLSLGGQLLPTQLILPQGLPQHARLQHSLLLHGVADQCLHSEGHTATDRTTASSPL